eukprot:11545236-Heterocapsa_arctica.AAC.1
MRGNKGSELKRIDPCRKWKGRYVFHGNTVQDEHLHAGVLNELSPTPVTLEAYRAVHAYGNMCNN